MREERRCAEVKLAKYTCPHCGKVLCIGQLSGIIKCKRCGKLTKLDTVRVKPAGGATSIAHQSGLHL
jgi:ribosomal protein L37AE/L43A